MNLSCPSCGHQDFDPEKQCECGYNADENFIIDTFVMETKGMTKEQIKGKALDNIVKPKSKISVSESVIKEIDSWVFSFSQEEGCIYLGTPALQSFRLKVTLEDLEELLEFMYKHTGREKTMRKLQLSTDEIPDLINKVNRMIEVKKSKVAVKFSSDELQEVADLVNVKLKV